MHYKMWHGITYRFANFNGSNKYLPMLGLKLVSVSTRGPWRLTVLAVRGFVGKLFNMVIMQTPLGKSLSIEGSWDIFVIVFIHLLDIHM